MHRYGRGQIPHRVSQNDQIVTGIEVNFHGRQLAGHAFHRLRKNVAKCLGRPGKRVVLLGLQGKGIDLDGFIGYERAKDGVNDIRQLAGLRIVYNQNLLHRRSTQLNIHLNQKAR